MLKECDSGPDVQREVRSEIQGRGLRRAGGWEVEAMLARADQDGDGMICYAEFVGVIDTKSLLNHS